MKKLICVVTSLLFSFLHLSAGTYSGGAGTEADPYQISTLSDLSELCQTSADWDKYFILTNDIDASQTQFWDDTDDYTDGDLYNDPNDSNGSGDNEGWPSIGDNSGGFEGEFDGNGYEISNLTSNRPAENSHGLFGYLDEAIIQNLGVVSVDFYGKRYMGGLAGNSTRSLISNCYTSGTIESDFNNYIGGLIGATSSNGGPPDGIIEGCHSACNIISSHTFVGGLVGLNGRNHQIIDSYASGFVVSDDDYVGGLVGENQFDALIYQCYASGSVTGSNYVGGLVGYHQNDAWILNCYSTGTVHIEENTGIVDEVGAFCGATFLAHISNSYTISSVVQDHPEIDNPEDKAFLGKKNTDGWDHFDNNFFDQTVSNQSSDGEFVSTGKTSAQMKSVATFTDETTTGLDDAWDFLSNPNDDAANNDYWDIDEGTSRPFFTWENRDMTWLGTNSTCDNANNWDGSLGLPTSDKNVIIPNTAVDPVLQSGDQADCNELTIQAGASLTLNDGASLITNSTISNAGTVSIQKSISQNEQWHLISSPNATSTADVFSGFYLQKWEESSASWQDVVNPATALTPVKGFSLFDDPAKTIFTFTGTPNTGNQTYSLTNHDNPGDTDGMNLIGNPYPSAIDLSVIDADYGAFHIWDPDANDYEEYNDGLGDIQNLAPMQGFFVYSTTNETFTITNEARTHTGATGFLKNNSSNIENGLVLTTNQMDKLFIKFKSNATQGFDFKYDAHKIISLGKGNSQIYSKYFDNKLAIDCRPETEIIQLGYQNNQNGNYSIELRESYGIATVELEDTKVNKIHDLNSGAYSFYWSTTDSEERFILHLKATGTDDLEEQDVLVYAANGQLYIRKNQNEAFDQLIIYDLAGRVITEKSIQNLEIQSFDLSYLNGIYLIQISGSNQQINKKIIF